MPVNSQTPGGGTDLPRRHDPDLGGLATFTLDDDGRVAAWSLTAAEVFGFPAEVMTGRDVCDVLMTGPGQRTLVRRALAETGAGQVLTATVAGGHLGEGRCAMRFEPLAAAGASVLVIAQRVSPPVTWLSQATARIGNSLDLFRTASEVTEAAVPAFADAAVIYMAERLLAAGELRSSAAGAGSGTVVRRLAGRLAGQDAGLHASLQRPGQVLALGNASAITQAMGTREPVLFDHLDSESAGRVSKSPGGREAAASYASFLAIPLSARDIVIGCAVFAREPASPAFSPLDITLASELASRAAVSIDNAWMYQRERRTALVLQQALVPSQPLAPEGVEVAHRSLPVGSSVIGGDWYDVTSPPGGKASLIIGDAMGHGPEAAAVMVQLRTAAHTLADLGLPPGELLRRLDALATGMTAATFATCTAAVVDPGARTCLIAQAGHVPPMLTLPGGMTSVLTLPPGLPLGLGAGSFDVTEISLPPGSTLALYTDGLVECRHRPLSAGLAVLRDALSKALASPAGTLGGACEAIINSLREDGEDDCTLLLARIRR